MNQLPLTFLFWIDVASLRAGHYRDTIAHYRDAIGERDDWGRLPRPYAYVRLGNAEKPLLSDAVDALLDLDVKPVVEDGSQLIARGGRSDLFHLMDRSEIQSVPYTLLVRGDHRVIPGEGVQLMNLLQNAVSVLATNPAVVSVGFANRFTINEQRVNDSLAIAPALRFPAVVRSRDLYLAALLSMGQPAPFMGDPDLPAANVLGAFSPSQARHLAFTTSIATTL